MAEGLPTPKSREQILSEMITEYVGLTGVNDLNTGSVLTQFFDVVARSIARTSGDIFQILRDFSVDRATAEALNRIGEEERIFRKTSRTASGTVKVIDTSFEKISTKIYAGASSPNVGATTIKVSDASKFPSSGTLYIGRGTANIEGPLNYSGVSQVGSYWEITLSSPTTKFHNVSETVILGQGGTRNVPVGTSVISPGSGAVGNITYTVSSAAILLDGENVNEFVQVVAQQPGSASNAPAGAIREFSSPPFSGATVINELPFTTGADDETDDDYRDRIKKERLSRGLGTSLAVKNSVLGAQSSDENAVITSNEIDTSNPEQVILYIDNGQGYEEKTEGVGIEFIVDSAVGGERSFQLATGGRQTSVAKAFLISSFSAPFDIRPFDRLAILVGGVSSEHIFGENDFKSIGAATAFEIVSSINDNTELSFEASTAEGGKKIVIRAKEEDNEYLQLTTPTSGTDTGPAFGFSENETRTILLYKNRELLDKNGRVAFVVSRNQFDWSNLITAGDTLTISVDGTDPITYTFSNQDFLEEGQHSTVSSQNTLSSWANVINNKITGVSAEVNGERLKLTSNLGSSNRASINIDVSSDLVSKGMFSEETGLFAEGNEADFEVSRNTAQIKLKSPLKKGDSLRLGSELTRAEILSEKILGGQTTVSDTAYVWLLVDDKNAEYISTGITGETFLDVIKPGGDIIRYESSSVSAFSNVQVGDYVIVWSNELSAGNRVEGRVNAVTATTLDIKLTSAESALTVEEGPIFFIEGFTVIRSRYIPQKIKIPAGGYSISAVAAIMNQQLDNARVSIDNDEVFVIRTNTEDSDGALLLVDFNDAAKSLKFVKNSKSESITSQLAYYESGNKDKQFPLFVHAEITSDVYADPPNSNILSFSSSQDLDALGIDDNGFVCFSQPYNSVEDVSSTECVEVQSFSGTSVNLEQDSFYRRSRVGDRFHLLNNYDFGHEDSIVVVLDGDFNQKTFAIPFYRTALTNITLSSNPNNFRAYDVEGGEVEFGDFFGTDFSFENYKCLMQARNIIDPGNPSGIPSGPGSTLPATNEDAILYRSAEWGRSGEKIGIGYFYPTSSDQEITHIVEVNEEINIKIFLKSGTARPVGLDGSTQWNITITPVPLTSTELVTYTYNGVGTAPGLATLVTGDYVSILNSTEFNEKNTGSYKIYSYTPNSFTITREAGVAVLESNISTLQTNGISFYAAEPTSASDILDYVNLNLTNFITASLIEDGGTTGAGLIIDSTEEDLDYSSKYVRLLDGKNYLLFSNLGATAGNPQFEFKNPLSLYDFSTNTLNAYSFNNGEKIRMIPLTARSIAEFLNILAVTGFTTIGKIKTVDRGSRLQLSSDTVGTSGSLQVVGGTASSSSAAIEGSAASIGAQSNPSCIVTIDDAASAGLHSDQWVKVFASDVQRKTTSINALNSIQITQSTPSVGYTKIEMFNKSIGQRFFGRNRYHTRVRGRTFKIENQGQFACISWDNNGTEPYFLKNNINIKDSLPSSLTFNKNEITNAVDINVDTGDMSFDEVAIGDIVTITNRANSGNNGSYRVLGVSEDGKTLQINNIDGVDELASGSFTITDNVTVVGGVFTVGTTILTEGIDFLVGLTADDTALNLSAAISLISNITASSSANVVNIVSDIPNVTVALNFSGLGAVASGAFLEATVANAGDVVVKSEVQEGDSVSILSDFNILNRGIYRVIRRFNNSIYIDNPSAVEEEVTITDNFITTGADSLTDYNVEKIDSFNRISWAGAGAEPSLEDVRPGDVVLLGSDFNANNQGEFHVISSGTKLQQITKILQPSGSDVSSGEYAFIETVNDEFYIWYNVDLLGGDPLIPSKTGIEVQVLSIDTPSQVAVKKANKINNDFSSYFSASVEDDVVTITNVDFGPVSDAVNVNIGGAFEVEIYQKGRLNFVDYINVNGVNETGIVITGVLEFSKEAIKFKEYEGTVAGDVFVITSNFLGNNNKKNFVIQEILNDSSFIATGVSVSTEKTLLDNNFNKIYLQEKTPYVGYKQISLICTNPSNLNSKNIVFNTANQFEKINEIGGVSVLAMSKLGFPQTISRGVDSYSYNTGLIAEANRIIYGDPRDNTTYPGVAAAGAEIFIKAPLVKRIEVSINIRIKTGIPFTTIVEEVRNTVASLINSNPVGNSIAISDIISTVGAIVGIQAVAISSPQYDAQNDVIRVNAGEKSLILDIVSDISVSKIE